MTTLTTKGGMVFEMFESLKEAKGMIKDCFIDNMDYISDDDTLFIKYKDGTYFMINGAEIEGKYRKTGIETIIIGNSATYQMYGDYRIYNMDDTDIEYSEDVDTEDTFWNVDER